MSPDVAEENLYFFVDEEAKRANFFFIFFILSIDR